MKRLPYTQNFGIASEYPIFDLSMAMIYTEDKRIILGRDPGRPMTGSVEEVNTKLLLPSEIALETSIEDRGGFRM